MRSKTSYFNPTLFRKNLTRFWPLWGGASALGALAPLALLTELVQSGFRTHAGQALELTGGYYAVLAYFIPAITLVYAALCALAVWHYLYNPRSVGLFHSLPITRKGLFVTNFLSGMAMMLIPYAVTGGLAVLVTAPAGLLDPVGVLVTAAGVLGDSFFYFAAATLVIFITGNPFAFAALYFIFHFLAAGMEWLLANLMTRFYLGVNQAYEGIAEFLSPTIFLSRSISAHETYTQIPTPQGWIEQGDIESVTLQNGWLIAVYALAGVALLGFAWALYQRRRSESAGDVVAVGWMKPVFRYGVALCAALAGGAALYVIFFENHQTRSTAGTLPMAVCMAVAGVTGYYIASMLLAKSLKVFHGSARGVLLTAAASTAICLLIAADPFGVESWVPQAEELNHATLYVYAQTGRSIAAEIDDPATVQKILDLHRAILAEKDTLDNHRDSRTWNGDTLDVYLYYTPLQNESFGDRNYTLPCSEATLSQSEALRQLEALATDPVVQEANIFNYRKGSRSMSEPRITGGYIGLVYNTQTSRIDGVDLSQEQAKVVEAAIRRDIQAGHFGKTLFLPDSDTYSQTVYSGDIQLNYNADVRRDDGSLSHYTPSINLNISTYCTETLQALKDLGVLDATHRLLTFQEYDSMERQEDGTWKFSDSAYPNTHMEAEKGTVIYPAIPGASAYEPYDSPSGEVVF